MYLVDTNVVSELRKKRLGRVDANVAAWASSVDAANLYVSAITVLELELGVLSMERKDATQGAKLRAIMGLAAFMAVTHQPGLFQNPKMF